MDFTKIKEEFKKIYGDEGIRTFHSPGRVNLIGEHIDYNGGYVLPCALDIGTYGCVSARKDRIVKLASTNFELRVSVDLDSIEFKKEDDWANYPKGVIKVMQQKGYKAGGMDILISGNIPNGSGLSSSALLELLIGAIINNLFNEGKIDQVELAKIGQAAENSFVGVSCGIMDQFAVGMGKKNKAILLNCGNLDYSYADVDLKEYTLVIMNTNKRRALNESKYNERRAECEKALEAIKKVKSVGALCELTESEYDEFEYLIKDENVKKRARHAVCENDRVKKAFNELNSGHIDEFGKLLIQSHNSLSKLYEVTGKELDTIVEEALAFNGCAGARMTGAGFGGCAIAVVLKNKVKEFCNAVAEGYTNKIGYAPSFYVTGIGDGTREIKG